MESPCHQPEHDNSVVKAVRIPLVVAYSHNGSGGLGGGSCGWLACLTVTDQESLCFVARQEEEEEER